MSRKLIVILIILIAGCIFSCGSKQPVQVIETDDYPVQNPVIVAAEQTEPTRAERVMRALFEVYPDIVSVEFRNDDWAVLLRNTWYYYAGGRLLPEDKVNNADIYRALQFYYYPIELPPWTIRTPEEIERFRSWTTNRRLNTLRRSSYFLDDLWRSTTRADTERVLVRITLFGRRLRVHQGIAEKLALIEARILEIAKTETEVQRWVNDINTVEGWHWRNIADVQARSYHSYGLAVDILLNQRAMRGRQTYWLWTSQYREDWWNVSYNERYHPPAAVINVFESHGFVWGGKWPLFDTMHFEYRPEILAFNGFHITHMPFIER